MGKNLWSHAVGTKNTRTRKLKPHLARLKDPDTAAAFEASVGKHLKDKEVTWPALATTATKSASKEH